MRSRKLLIAWLMLLALPGGLPAAGAATLNVAVGGADADGCGTKTAPCRSISRAIAAAAPGDKILVGPGRYGDLDADGTFGEAGEETGAGAVVTIDKAIVVESVEGAATTLIDGGNAALFGVQITAAGARLGKAKKGFTVARAGLAGVVVALNGTGATVSGIRSVRNGSGIASKASNLTIRGNVADANTGGGFAFTGANVVITGCRATGNGTSGFSVGGTANVLKGNVASNNVTDGFSIGGGEGHVLTGCVGAGNATGLRVASSGLVATGNSFVGNSLEGIAVASPGTTITKSNVFGNGAIGDSNCGVRTIGAGTVTLDQMCFGTPAGPGADPADAVCETGPIIVNEISKKAIKVGPKVPL